MIEVVSFENYLFTELSNGEKIHKDNVYSCRWCKSGLGKRVQIPIDNNEILDIPYCSRKCYSQDPNYNVYIETFKEQSESFKTRYLQQQEEENSRYTGKVEGEKSEMEKGKMREVVPFGNYIFTESYSGKKIHKHNVNNCLWCNKGFFRGNERVMIPIGNNEILDIPYCSKKCLSEDPSQIIYIETFKVQSESYKIRYLQQQQDENRKREKAEQRKSEIEKGKMRRYTFFAIPFAILLILPTFFIDGDGKFLYFLVALIIWQLFRMYFSPK
jgi:hypothetical protein